MAWFSKNFIAIAASKRERIQAFKAKKKRGKTETFHERCMLSHLKRLGFVAQWKFGKGKFGRYRADFYHPKARICVEIDGESHFSEEAAAKDQIRTYNLINGYGVNRVVRFKNSEVREKKSRKICISALKTILSQFHANQTNMRIPITERNPNTIKMGLQPSIRKTIRIL